MRNDTCGLQARTFTLCALPVPAETQGRALERQAASEERIAEAVLLVVNVLIGAAVVWRWWRGK